MSLVKNVVSFRLFAAVLSVPAVALLMSIPAEAQVEVQTDWSGGPGAPGPVTHWQSGFDESTDAAWRSIEGQVALSAYPRISPVQSIVAGDAEHPDGVTVGDIDGDGHADIIQCNPHTNLTPLEGEIRWWKRQPSGSWIMQLLHEFYGARFVDCADVDLDGDLDVIAAAYYGVEPPPSKENRNGRYAWFENKNGDASAWRRHLVGEMFWGASFIDAADFDGDGDLDLCGASDLTNIYGVQEADVVWFENLDGAGTAWEQHDLAILFYSADEAHAGDLDGDGDMDIVATKDSEIWWWENVFGNGTAWSPQPISTTDFKGSGFMDLGDIDNDGDLDIIGSGYNSSLLIWWQNVDGSGDNWKLGPVVGFAGGWEVKLEDLDGDNDLDALFCYDSGGSFGGAGWAENASGNGQSWAPHLLKNNFGTSPRIAVGDVNSDGKLDAVVTITDFFGHDIEQISWWDLTRFLTSGELSSSILDGGLDTDWDVMTWDAAIEAGASLAVQVRASNDPMNLGAYVDVANSGDDLEELIDPTARYLQYRLVLSTLDADTSPIVREISVALEGQASLTADKDKLPESTGGTVNFLLEAGSVNGSRDYILLGTLSGTEPGTLLPGGAATLPLNWDIFTTTVILLANTSLFQNFQGVLDTSGTAAATMNFPGGTGIAGAFMHFAYALNKPWDEVSNPVGIFIE